MRNVIRPTAMYLIRQRSGEFFQTGTHRSVYYQIIGTQPGTTD
jgi:hypothetical protein